MTRVANLGNLQCELDPTTTPKRIIDTCWKFWKSSMWVDPTTIPLPAIIDFPLTMFFSGHFYDCYCWLSSLNYFVVFFWMLFGIGWWAELGVNKDANTHLQETIKEAFNYTFCTLLTLIIPLAVLSISIYLLKDVIILGRTTLHCLFNYW